jgi:hypothetical protein
LKILGMSGMKKKSEGNVHVYPVKDSIRHETNMGAGGCYCEPIIKEIVYDPRQNNLIIARVILHQKLKGKEVSNAQQII